MVASHHPVTSTSSTTSTFSLSLSVSPLHPSSSSSSSHPSRAVHSYLLSSLDSILLGKSCHCAAPPTSSPLSGLSCPPAFHLAPTTTTTFMDLYDSYSTPCWSPFFYKVSNLLPVGFFRPFARVFLLSSRQSQFLRFLSASSTHLPLSFVR